MKHRLATIAFLIICAGCSDITKKKKTLRKNPTEERGDNKNPHEEYSLWKDTGKVKEPIQLEKYIPEYKEVSLEELVDAFRSGRNQEYAMNAKYSGEVLKVTGRTSGVNEDGYLRLQIAPFHDVVLCKGIVDHDVLLSVKKDDIVEVTGLFERVKTYGGHRSQFSICYDVKIVR